MECDLEPFRPVQLSLCRKIQTCTSSMRRLGKTSPRLTASVHVSEFCLRCCIFIFKKNNEQTAAVTDAFAACLLDIKTLRSMLNTFPFCLPDNCINLDLTPLFYFLQCGFFTRSLQDDSVPRYHAVRIKRGSPEDNDGTVKPDPFEKKPWMTTWSDYESYS